MIINAFVRGQELKLYTPKLVANSVNHLDAEFNFLTSEWDGLKKWAHFVQGDTQYIFELRNDNIEKGDGLNLTEGKWNVWLHGSEVSDDLTEVTRITTEIAEIEVLPSGIVLGEPLPVVPPSFGEQLEKRVSVLEKGYVSPTVELEEIDNGHKITFYDKNNPNGNSFELFDGVGIEEIYEDIVINPDSLEAPKKHRLVFVLTNGQEYYTEYTVYNGRSPHIYVEDGYIKYNYGEHDGEQPIGGHDIISLDELRNHVIEELDLSGFSTKEELETKVNKVQGKSLIADTEIERLAGVDNYDDSGIWQAYDEQADIISGEQKKTNELINSVANAVKGAASGSVIEIDDISPIEHNLSVRANGKNLFNTLKISTGAESSTVAYISNVTENSITVSTKEGYTGNGICATGLKLRELCPGIEIGKTYMLNAKTDSNHKYIYLSDSGSTWSFEKSVLVTNDMLESKVSVYGLNAKAGYGVGNCVIQNIQVEEGETATEYEPYVNPTTATIQVYNGNLDSEPTEYTPLLDGTVEGVTSIYPTMTLLTDTEGITIECEYNRDTNKVIEELTETGGSIGGDSIGGGSIGGDSVGGVITNAITTVEALPETGTEGQTILLIEKEIKESNAYSIKFKTPNQYPDLSNVPDDCEFLFDTGVEGSYSHVRLDTAEISGLGFESDESNKVYSFVIPSTEEGEASNLLFLPNCTFMGNYYERAWYHIDTSTYELTRLNESELPAFNNLTINEDYLAEIERLEYYKDVLDITPETEVNIINKGLYIYSKGKWQRVEPINSITTVNELPKIGADGQTVLLLEKGIDESGTYSINFKIPNEYPDFLSAPDECAVAFDNAEFRGGTWSLHLDIVIASEIGVVTEEAEKMFSFRAFNDDEVVDIVYLPNCTFWEQPFQRGWYQVDTSTYELTALNESDLPKYNNAVSVETADESIENARYYKNILNITQDATTSIANKGFYTVFNGKWQPLSFN